MVILKKGLIKSFACNADAFVIPFKVVLVKTHPHEHHSFSVPFTLKLLGFVPKVQRCCNLEHIDFTKPSWQKN